MPEAAETGRFSEPIAHRGAPSRAHRAPNGHGGQAWPATDRARNELGYEVAKRAFDITFALALAAVLAPVWITAAVLVKLTSPGPVLFRQRRCGRNGRTFEFYKFRTMVDGAEGMKADLLHLNEVDGPVFKMRNDPRVTWVGRWLRRASIDEVPNLINVVQGHMSVVGPRPPVPQEVALYRPRDLQRLSVKPGLTCLWQVSGRSTVGFDQWMELDLAYIRSRSFWLDLMIVVRTVPAVLRGTGAS